LSFLRALKIGSFNLGSAMADILTASVWNRVLISDLGASATPVALLLALRYLLAPLSVWFGLRSDTRPIFGLRRLPYIWLGRLLMLAGIVLLPIGTLRLAANVGDPIGWATALVIFVFYGLGTAISGGPFLALIHDSAPAARRGVAISIAQTILIAGFAASPILFARLLPTYSADRFQSLALLTAIGAGAIWLFSILGEERRAGKAGSTTAAQPQPGLREALRSMWADRRTRGFLVFLSLGAIASFAQDAVLEPFGGDVFGLSVDATTRFSAYFGGGVLLMMIVASALTRRRRPEEQSKPAAIGLSVMIVGLAGLAVAGLSLARWLITPALIVFGLGFGVYTVGGVSLLMAMTTEKQAGAYLGLWTMTQLVSRGVGIGLGGVVRDVGLALSGSIGIAYAAVFVLEAVGLAVCIWLLSRLDVAGFAREHQVEVGASPLTAMAD
jgi:BCD family chlorophyll transporter-like MFS transporter